MNYVVGDIQGCYSGLRRLLKKIDFSPSTDRLWAVGDLVARGEDSLSTLQFLQDLGGSFFTVLGNHDLHLLSVLHDIKPAKTNDRLGPVLKHPHRHDFADWLRQYPLATLLDDNTLLSHAGLFPQWSFSKALRLSKSVQNRLKQSDYVDFLPTMYSSRPQLWDKHANSDEQQVFTINAMTRMRYLDKKGALEFNEKRAPADASPSLTPWFKVHNSNISSGQRVVFGHWASLQGQTDSSKYIGLDTGYVWGGCMSCLCLESNQIIRITE